MHVGISNRVISSVSNYLDDIYDGKVWSDFHSFLSQKHSWCFALNVDWFQPFCHITDTVGALHLVILNLHREERYKRQNMLLLLVLELQEFYKGLPVQCLSRDSKCLNVNVRLALVGVFCDFTRHNRYVDSVPLMPYMAVISACRNFQQSHLGKVLTIQVMIGHYGGVAVHRQKSYEHLNAKTKHQQKLIEKAYCIRYSVPTKLPYLNPIRHNVIDPMHNLFLGTAKHCMELWTKKEILN